MSEIEELITKGNIENIDCKNQEDFFNKVNEELKRLDYVESSFLDAMKDREKKFPTGLQTNKYCIALNHVDSCHVKVNALFIYKLKNKILYKKMDNPAEELPVSYVFVLLIKDHDLQVKAISGLCKLFTNDEFMDSLNKFSSKQDLLNFIKRKEEQKQWKLFLWHVEVELLLLPQ